MFPFVDLSRGIIFINPQRTVRRSAAQAIWGDPRRYAVCKYSVLICLGVILRIARRSLALISSGFKIGVSDTVLRDHQATDISSHISFY